MVNAMNIKLGLREAQVHDLNQATSYVRSLEMTMDHDVPYYIANQFWADVRVYGFREAFVYFCKNCNNESEKRESLTQWMQHPEKLTDVLDTVRKEVNDILKSGGREVLA